MLLHTLCLLSPASKQLHSLHICFFRTLTLMNCMSAGTKPKCTCKARKRERKSICNKHRKSSVWARRLSSGSTAKESSSTEPFHCLGMAPGRYTSEYPDRQLCVTHNPLPNWRYIYCWRYIYTASREEYSTTICYNRIKRLRKKQC